MVLLKTVTSGQWSVVRRGLSLFTDGVKRSRRIGTVPIGLALFTFYFLLFTGVVFAEEKTYRIKVDGMHCKSCVYSVTKSLKKLKQVKDVNVNLDEGTATVTLNDGEDVTQEALSEAIEDSGYKPDGIETVNR